MKLTLTTDRKFLYMISAIVGGFILLFISFPIFSRLIDSWQKIGSLKQTTEKLSAKKDVLTNVDAKTLSSSATAVRALPTKFGALAAVAQIRAAAQEKGIDISRIQVTIKENANPETAQIKIDVGGSIPTINEFLKIVEKTLPYVVIGEGKTSKTAELLETSIIFETYWKDVPKLPGVGEALPELSAKEKEFLTKLGEFKQTTSIAVPSTEGQGRANPFSF